MRRLRLLAVIAAAAFCSLSAATALADGITGLTFQVGVVDNENAQMTITDQMIQAQIDAGNMTLATDPDTGLLVVSGGSFEMAGMWRFDLTSVTFDPDPIVSQVGGLTNLSPSAQDFFISTTIPVIPVVPSSLIGGSTVLTYGDANFDGLGGLTNTVSGASGYAGSIDGVEKLSLLGTFGLTPAFPGDATQSVSEVDGLPGPTIPSDPALLTIGVTNRFNLSASDAATWNSTFQVVVPEPGTGLLLGTGVALLALARRRVQLPAPPR